MLRRRSALVLLVATPLAGCGGSRISTMAVAQAARHPVQSIAIAPDGGLLADAVAVELAGRGFNVLDPSTTSRLLVRLNLSEVEVSRPEGLGRLREQGIDAWLSVRASGGHDGLPQSASARVNSTHNGRVMAGVTWQNGWGGQAGSIADRTMRRGLSDAAAEIATALQAQLA